ncbi:zinc ribbon domain-containing protein [uncultured Methanobrevibacter sp.]|uniref:zinc ribbon domain-containing protein n=1 Tax=uncultured Methanobrevibacter sp. TaxID=253161 RepID=UPI002608FEC1|nr:zinc-ribbon domain-containing protein [uncultured Methanobrevibacter sp.]
MVLRRCPNCHATSDDQYGFCIKCGYEFPKIAENENACPYCGFSNPEEATFCVKCGTPLIFKSQTHEINNSLNPIIIKKEISKSAQNMDYKPTSKIIIILGYIFSLLGGIIGAILAIYLATRKDPIAKKHGYIQLTILILYGILILVLYLTGNLDLNTINNATQMLNGNLTSINP